MSARNPRGVFISYRRDESGDTVGRLKDRFVREKVPVFVDLDMTPGSRFPELIENKVRTSAVVLAVIGPAWLDASDAQGRRRLDGTRDFVRLEIETALRYKVPLIPVLIKNSGMPDRDDLPDGLADLADHHALALRNETFSDDFGRLKRAVDQLVRPAPYVRIMYRLAGLLMILAGVGFGLTARTLTGPPAVQISDSLAVVGSVVIGAILLLTRPRWESVGWSASIGLLVGLAPFIAIRFWRGSELRGLLSWIVPGVSIGLVAASLILVAFLLARSPVAGFALPRIVGDLPTAAAVLGVVACVAMAIVGVTLPTSGDDLSSLRYSDPALLLVAAVLGALVTVSRGVLRGFILGGWICGAVAVLGYTIWLRSHPEFRIPSAVLDAHLLLAASTVLVLAATAAVSWRPGKASPAGIAGG